MKLKNSALQKIISMMIAAAFLFWTGTVTALPDIIGTEITASAAEKLTYGDFNYEVSSNNSYVTITKYNGSASDLVIPESIDGIKVKEIGSYTFRYCTGLTSITLPNSLTYIGSDAFSGCTGLTSINVDINNSAYSSEYGVLFNKNKTEIITFPAGKNGTYTIPDSVTSIGERAFEFCSGLTSITIPDSVTSIGYYAFHQCTGLTSIIIPDSVTYIGNYALDQSNSLTIYGRKGGYAENYAKINDIKFVEVSQESKRTISFDTKGGNTIISEDRTNVQKYGELSIPKKRGYIFKGWSLNETTENKSFFEEDTNIYFQMPEIWRNHYSYYNTNPVIYCHLWNTDNEESIYLWKSNEELCSYIGNNIYKYTIPAGTNVNAVIFASDKFDQTNDISLGTICSNDILTIPEPDSPIILYPSEVNNTEGIGYWYESEWAVNKEFKSLISSLPFSSSSDYLDYWYNNRTRTVTSPSYVTIDDYKFVNSDTTIPIPIDHTLYAVWEEAELFRLKYDMNGRSGAVETQNIYSNETAVVTSYIPERSDRIFLGWSKSSDQTNPLYKANDNITLTSDTTLYAVWGQRDIGNTVITLSKTSYDYDGSEKCPIVTVKYDNQTVTSGYRISYENNINAGTAYAVITGTGKYIGTVKKTFTITPKSIKLTDITLSSTSYTYNGSSKTPAVTVTDGTKTLVSGTDYSVKYTNNINTGTAKVTVTGAGNYKDSVEKTFTIDKKSIKLTDITLSSTSYTYNGSSKTPAVTVTDGTKTLVSGTDYSVKYTNNINTGTAKVTVTGMGNYKDSVEKNFTIDQKSLSNAEVNLSSSSYVFNGKAKKPTVTVTLGTKTLISGTDYSVKYTNNINAGTAKVTVTGTGNYKDSAYINFAITPKNISGMTFNVEPQTMTYNGTAQKPNVSVADSDKTLVKDTDYTVSVSNNINAGTANISFKGKNNYTGTVKKTFVISPKSVKTLTIKLSSTQYTYDGKPKLPTVTITDGTETLSQDTDYTISYKNNTNAGTASVIITGTGNYNSTVTKSFTIASQTQQELNGRMVTINPSNFVYDHKVHRPYVKVIDGKTTLKEETDYTISYTGTVNAGQGNVIVKGIGKYTGTVTKTFTISAKSVQGIQVSAEKNSYIATGSAIRPAVSVKDGKYDLVRGTDYAVSYSDNKNTGIGKITISGKNNYKDETCVYFAIVNPKNDFEFGKDNWGFINASYNGDFKNISYKNMINDDYKKILKSNLSNSEYQTIFLGDGKESPWLSSTFSGACHGMSALAWLSEAGFINYSDYKKNASSLYDLDRPSDNIKISSLITYYQMLQAKDVTQQQYRTIPNKSNKENIEKIINLLKAGNNVLIGYKQKDYGGHSVLAYGYEEGISRTINGITYNGRIKVYDPNFKGYNSFADIYFNSKYNYNWFIRDHGANGISSSQFGARLNYISADIGEINEGGILSLKNDNSKNKFVARIDAPKISNNRSISKVAETASGSYMNYASDDIIEDYSFMNAGDSAGTIGYNLYDPDASYKVEQDDPNKLSLMIDYEKCNFSAYSASGRSVIFDKKGYIILESNSSEFQLAMTWDNDYPTQWFTIQVSGDDVNEASLLRKNNGYILKADNLKNIKIRMNNKEESVSASFTTKYKSAYIYETDDNKIGVKVDTDGNGTHETKINTVEILENLSSISNDEIITGDSITINVDASGGKGNYNYAVWYRRSADTSWKTKQSYSANSTITFKPAYTGEYEISVGVRDGSGKVTKKYFTLKVNEVLQNISTISSKSIKFGSSVTINAKGYGGLGNYKYGVWYKRDGEDTWKTKQDYSDKSKITFKPAAAVKYYVRVKVKDERKTTVTKTFTLTVK